MTEAVTLALSELRSLITKAARGAGLSWGMAEEAGWAAEWLARRGMPAADWATIWLASRMDGAITALEVGVALADGFARNPALKGAAFPDGLGAPGYVLPFLHRIAQAGSPVKVVSNMGQVAFVSPEGNVDFGPSWQLRSEGWSLLLSHEIASSPDEGRRPIVSASVIECLEGLGLRTTVPRSETSRRDAGSSGGDND